MLCAQISRAFLLSGTVFLAAIVFAPAAIAHVRSEGAWRHEMVYGERSFSRAHVVRTSAMRREHLATLESRRERLFADERERAITAELNLVQLRGGRARAAEIAEWQLRHGAVFRG